MDYVWTLYLTVVNLAQWNEEMGKVGILSHYLLHVHRGLSDITELVVEHREGKSYVPIFWIHLVYLVGSGCTQKKHKL